MCFSSFWVLGEGQCAKTWAYRHMWSTADLSRRSGNFNPLTLSALLYITFKLIAAGFIFKLAAPVNLHLQIRYRISLFWLKNNSLDRILCIIYNHSLLCKADELIQLALLGTSCWTCGYHIIIKQKSSIMLSKQIEFQDYRSHFKLKPDPIYAHMMDWDLSCRVQTHHWVRTGCTLD